ncbi:MAG: hypothetical protein R2729_03920 [Bryobacteraceae bacterium]
MAQGTEVGAAGTPATNAVSVTRELYELTSGATRLTYVIDRPYGKVLKQLRATLKARGFQIPMEMDVSGRIADELGVTLKPCLVLYIDCPFLLLEAAIIDAAAAGALVPLEMVVTEAGSQCVISLVPRTERAVTACLRVQFGQFFGRILLVLREIGAHREVHEFVV